MEIKIIEEKKNRMVFQLSGVETGFCTLLKDELNKDSKIKIATFAVEHPLVSLPQFIIETDGTDPRKVLSDTAGKLKKQMDKLEEIALKEV